MTLKRYKEKRDFTKTPEPPANVKASKTGQLYLIQKHAASHLHYDFRLELNGVLKSWAVPKGPSLDPNVKRLAVAVEDHPLDYGHFEGVIPKDQYGGGTVMLWDTGQWYPKDDAVKAYKKGDLTFELKGKKLKGLWKLIRIRTKDDKDTKKNWLLMKLNDKYAKPLSDYDITVKKPKSVISKRDISEIASDYDQVWDSAKGLSTPKKSTKKKSKIDVTKIAGAKKRKFPNEVTPELATLVGDIPDSEEWLHELKFDGYRLLIFINKNKIRLVTRNHNDWTDKFPSIVKAFEKISCRNAILDGELVALNDKGFSDFQLLQNAIDNFDQNPLAFYTFDLLYLNNYDITQATLIDRKSLLQELLSGMRTQIIRFSDHIVGDGKVIFAKACELDLEGIVSKRRSSHYIQKRTRDWLKIKCSKEQEFVVGGYTDPKGGRSYFGALLIGYYDDNQKFHYSGRVGTGFNEKSLEKMHKLLTKHKNDTSPFVERIPGRNIHWVKPNVVIEVEFKEWTKENILRQASFKGVRLDKKPMQVKREHTKKW